MTTLATNSHKRTSRESAPALSTQTSRPKVDPRYIQTFVENLFGDDLHAMRVLSLANGVDRIVREHAAFREIFGII